VLEVGCGTGGITAWLAGRVAPGHVTAIDFSPNMVERARRKHPDADVRCRDVCRDDLGRAAYDVVLCYHSFPHFRDQRRAAQAMARALRPGGRLVVLHLSGAARINALHDDLGGEVGGDHLPDAAGWDALLGQAGLRKVTCHDRDDLFLLIAEKPCGSGQ